MIRRRTRDSANFSRRRPLRLEALEDRRTLAADISPEAMEFIYDLNRARHDPQAYGAEVGFSASLLAGVAARAPLAVNLQLADSALFHATEMATHNYFSHQSLVTGDWPNQMARDAGYDLASWLPSDNNTIESLAAGTFYNKADTPLRDLIEDHGLSTPGHRYHLLADGPSSDFWLLHTEIGVGHASSASATYTNYWAVHTGFHDDPLTFLTGVVYNDLDHDGRYDAGEGLGGVTIDAGGGRVTVTNSAGGWSLAVGDGEYTIQASGAGLAVARTVVATVAGQNVEVDFIAGESGGYVDFAHVAGPTTGAPVQAIAFDPATGRWLGVTLEPGASAAQVAQLAKWGPQNNWEFARTGDWDGDGDLDAAARTQTGRWYLGLNDGAGHLVTQVGWFWSASIGRNDVLVGDFDGDGRDDIVHRTDSGNWYVSRWTAGGSFVVDLYSQWQGNSGWQYTQVGDFNGDSRSDVASQAANGWWHVGLSTGSQFNSSQWIRWSSVPRLNVLTGDFNGDGRDDIAAKSDTGYWYVAESDGAKFTTRLFGRWSASVERLDVQVGDYNGDGRDDIAGRTTSGQWYVAESDGSQFVTDDYGRWSGGYLTAITADWDRDGRDDLLGLRTDGRLVGGLSDGDLFGAADWGAWPAGAWTGW